jgi:hypothetical protein
MHDATPLKGWLEWDALTGWRKVLHWRPGERKEAKTSYNRRLRRRARHYCRADENVCTPGDD